MAAVAEANNAGEQHSLDHPYNFNTVYINTDYPLEGEFQPTLSNLQSQAIKVAKALIMANRDVDHSAKLRELSQCRPPLIT